MILLQATIENIATREDKTLKITVGTQEIPSDKAGELIYPCKPDIFKKTYEAIQ